jgi:choline dehydrogenase-like flavoprotein
MLDSLHCVAARLGGRWLIPPSFIPCGASYHEAGTLRIAHTEQEGAAAEDGLLFGTENIFVGDGAAFTSIGVANPILTLTAMGYRLADRLTDLLRSM